MPSKYRVSYKEEGQHVTNREMSMRTNNPDLIADSAKVLHFARLARCFFRHKLQYLAGSSCADARGAGSYREGRTLEEGGRVRYGERDLGNGRQGQTNEKKI